MNYILPAFGVLGILFGLRCYVELHRWARQCQRAQIAISYNRRVKLTASLAEYLGWINQLDGQEANGRTIFTQNKMAVSILKAKPATAKTTVKTIRHSRRSRKNKVPA